MQTDDALQVLREPGRAPQSESYMWLYRTGADTDRPIVLYEYQPGRGAKHPKAFAGFGDTSIRTAMPDTTVFRRKSL